MSTEFDIVYRIHRATFEEDCALDPGDHTPSGKDYQDALHEELSREFPGSDVAVWLQDQPGPPITVIFRDEARVADKVEEAAIRVRQRLVEGGAS